MVTKERFAFAVLFFTCHAVHVSANQITNGGFEIPIVSGINQEFGAVSNAVPGWLITEGSIDVVHTGTTVLGTAHSGVQMIDINGSRGGAIQQQFPTLSGYPYRVSVYYSNNPNPSMAQPSYSAAVEVAGGPDWLLSESVVHSGATAEDMDWQCFSRAFVANSNTAVLRLRSLQSGYNGVYFDTVSVDVIPDHAGDFDKDGVLAADDIDLILHAIRTGSEDDAFDLTGDGVASNDDARLWVVGLRRTFFGDANLDDEFNSSDMVQVFAAGKYERGWLDELGNIHGAAARWAEGDWDGNGIFDASDLVMAFADGGYEKGKRTGVATVPEPSGWMFFVIGLLVFQGIIRN